MKSTAPKEQSLHFWLIFEYASLERRPFVMISRCNGVLANNSCRELLVLAPVLRKLNIGTKVHRVKELNPKRGLTLHKATYFCLDAKVTKDQAEVFKTGSLILR